MGLAAATCRADGRAAAAICPAAAATCSDAGCSGGGSAAGRGRARRRESRRGCQWPSDSTPSGRRRFWHAARAAGGRRRAAAHSASVGLPRGLRGDRRSAAGRPPDTGGRWRSAGRAAGVPPPPPPLPSKHSGPETVKQAGDTVRSPKPLLPAFSSAPPVRGPSPVDCGLTGPTKHPKPAGIRRRAAGSGELGAAGSARVAGDGGGGCAGGGGGRGGGRRPRQQHWRGAVRGAS